MNEQQPTPEARELRLEVGDGEVGALLLMPPEPAALYVFAHGAGAGMRHRFMADLAARLAAHGVATLRYDFPYMAAGGRRPDRPPKLHAAVRAAVAKAAELLPGVPLFAGGKSMGGRMTSGAAAEEELPGVRGLVFVGFPLHPAGKPGTTRADHLVEVELPMLFLQGDRDKLADLVLLRPVVEHLAERATLHVVEGADHGFHVLKRSGRTDEEVMEELAGRVGGWVEGR
ncbi:MAG TPA: alpha/beta family hydrolase [Thermoanaerobaculia bacterium]|nr:alpha/beta family hydrolase [Thermoanaerobaculia bacterium]